MRGSGETVPNELLSGKWFWDLQLSSWPFTWILTAVPTADIEFPQNYLTFRIFARTEKIATRKAFNKLRRIVDVINSNPF